MSNSEINTISGGIMAEEVEVRCAPPTGGPVGEPVEGSAKEKSRRPAFLEKPLHPGKNSAGKT
jgi:hypothetical protein